MRTLIILNDAPYGGERTYNGLRLALALQKAAPEGSVTIFLMGDAVLAAKAGQHTPEGYYNLERMLDRLVLAKGVVLACGTCMAARALTDGELLAGAQHSTMDALAEATVAADKVLVF
ncbi:DsrE/DsrF/TusD sulfur relay family protein [Phenylobacterium aquaticum]|uniref:DsrE/DsrF/TusD sulfur relay family protein n=1 Tax=Phenylobacterium aquaticum TaxID=1763816 RepID=UPI001F5C3ADD|nr:DsrE family protein [Phenylobacterium aquaticum]MCI3132818.1 DsrE family protein [Phenylobacterium aquaticum]